MTAIQKWVTDMVAVALGDLRCRPDDEGFAEAEQRISCLLVQSRALECRHIAGELLIRCPGQIPAMQLSGWLTERSRKLEAVAMDLAKNWPIKDENQ
jgi:hypothetical protein